MNPARPLSFPRTWNPASRQDEALSQPGRVRRREIWFVAFLILFVLLVLIWQQNRTWKLTHELDSLTEERAALESRVRLLGTQVAEKRQPDFVLADLLDEENPSLDLAGRYMVPADPLPGDVASLGRTEAWLASLGITVPSALAQPNR